MIEISGHSQFAINPYFFKIILAIKLQENVQHEFILLHCSNLINYPPVKYSIN